MDIFAQPRCLRDSRMPGQITRIFNINTHCRGGFPAELLGSSVHLVSAARTNAFSGNGFRPRPGDAFPWSWRGKQHWVSRLGSQTVKKQYCRKAEDAIGGHMLLRKSAITAAGGLFDDNIFMYFEDTDLCRRLKNAGYGLYLLPTARAIHSWQCQPEKAHLSEASHRYYLNKHFPSSRWNVAQSFLKRHLQPRLPSSVDLGVLNEPPNLPVPQGWQSGWILEGSAQPLMVPAAYLAGVGPVATFSAEVWSLLGKGNYWIQLSPARNYLLPKEIQRFMFRISSMNSVV